MAFMSKDDIASLRAYVTAPGNNGQNQSESTVLLTVTHSNLQARFLELRLDLHMTIADLKAKLYSHCGTSAAAMTLQLKDDAGRLVATMVDDRKMLGYYSPCNGFILHIIDRDPHSMSANGWLEDTSKVEKYMMSDEDYALRENTYRKYKEEKLKQDPTWTLQKEMAKQRGVPLPQQQSDNKPNVEELAEFASKIEVGQRCSVTPGDRRGCVKYVGAVVGLPEGPWVGVQYDEPLGKNDGSVKGKRYFDCPTNYGAFIRPDKLQVGDYPPLDDEFSDLGSEDEI